MAEDREELAAVEVEAEEEEGYQPPPQRSIDELLQADQVTRCSCCRPRGGTKMHVC
jgi:hypothetical protein